MQKLLLWDFKKHPLGLSIVGHLIIIFIWLIMLFFQSRNPTHKKELQPEIYVPSFIYNAASQRAVSQNNSSQNNSQNNSSRNSQQKNLLTDKTAFENFKNIAVKSGMESLASPPPMNQYILDYPSKNIPNKKLDPVHVLGEKLMDDPLRRLLGVALTAHLNYPKVARELQLRGVVSIQLLLYPNGEIKNIYLLKSSKESILDLTALDAVHAMSPVHNVDLYVKEPKMLVFNVIFR